MVIDDRIRQAAEQILDDESLTGELQDQEAQVLLDWGIAQSRRLCEQTLEMDDAEAEEYLSTVLPNLRFAIRRTNKLLGSMARIDAGMIADGLTGIFESCALIPGLSSAPPDDLANLAGTLAELLPADALTRILSLLTPEVIDGP
jgi:hypothetical protein